MAVSHRRELLHVLVLVGVVSLLGNIAAVLTAKSKFGCGEPGDPGGVFTANSQLGTRNWGTRPTRGSEGQGLTRTTTGVFEPLSSTPALHGNMLRLC